jgi:hypothetical protein
MVAERERKSRRYLVNMVKDEEGGWQQESV